MNDVTQRDINTTLTQDQILNQIEDDWDNMRDSFNSTNSLAERFALMDDAKTVLFNNIQKLIDLAYEEGQNNMQEALLG